MPLSNQIGGDDELMQMYFVNEIYYTLFKLLARWEKIWEGNEDEALEKIKITITLLNLYVDQHYRSAP